jgi:hypothetical protein
MRLFLCGALLAAFASGCYATTSGSVGYSGTVTATTVAPDLVYVSPGVQVIADYDEPVFYSDGYYWRETNGSWYRSTYHTGGWAYAAPPRTVISVQNRHSYRRYRPSGYVPRHQRDHRDHRVRDNRDHRDNRDWNRNNNTRDHRTNDHARDHRPNNTRDHRTHQPARDNNNWQQPARDTRDHRTNDTRDHRKQQPARDTRDHREHKRDTRDHRDDNKRDRRR